MAAQFIVYLFLLMSSKGTSAVEMAEYYIKSLLIVFVCQERVTLLDQAPAWLLSGARLISDVV